MAQPASSWARGAIPLRLPLPDRHEQPAIIVPEVIRAPVGGENPVWPAALVHGSELRTDPPSPDTGSRHSVTVRHPETCLQSCVRRAVRSDATI